MERVITEQVKGKLMGARDLILKEVKDHYAIPQLSKMVDLDQPMLKYGFKKLFGQGPFKILTSARLEKAAELIANTDLSIAVIARTCGYNHATNMTAAFRRHFSKKPSDLRKHPIPN